MPQSPMEALWLAQQERLGMPARSSGESTQLALARANSLQRSAELKALALQEATQAGQAELESLRGRTRVEVVDAAEAYAEERNAFGFYKGIDESGFPEEEEPLRYVTPAELSAEAEDEYVVVHERVAVRKQPNSTARVLEVLLEGDRVRIFGFDETRTWCKTRLRLRGSIGGIVEAWVMIRHGDLGVLLEPSAPERAAEEDVPPEPSSPERPGQEVVPMELLAPERLAEEEILEGTAAGGDSAPWPKPRQSASEGVEEVSLGEPTPPQRSASSVKRSAKKAQRSGVAAAGDPSKPSRSAPAGPGAFVADGGPAASWKQAYSGRRGEAAPAPSRKKAQPRRKSAGRQLEAIVQNHSWMILGRQDLAYCISEMELAGKEPAVTVTTGDGTQIACCKDITRMVEARRCQYEVVRRPVVIARCAPLASATMLGAIPCGTFVDTFGKDESGKWVRVLGQFGTTQYFGIAWMLTEHTEFGTLLVAVEE